MKKQTLLPVLVLLLMMVFTFNKVKAGPGDSCIHPVVLSPSSSYTITDYAFHSPDTAIWFKFTADSSHMLIVLTAPRLPADTPAQYIHTMKLYSGTSCGSLTLVATSTIAFFGSDTLPELCEAGLTPGATYYISVSKYNTGGCRICNKYPAYVGILLQHMLSTFPVPATCVTKCTNLVCNGTFIDTPNVVLNYGYPLPAANCSAYSTMKYNNGNYGADDYYAVSRYNNGAYFIQPTGPFGEKYSFCGNSPDFVGGPTPFDTAWAQVVPIVPNAQYQWTIWFRDLDNTNYPGAIFRMIIPHVGMLYRDQISYFTYYFWQEICVNWTAGNQTSVELAVMDSAAGFWPGYDFFDE